MKKVIAGAGITLTGALLFLSVFIAAGNFSTVISGWDRHGRFWSSVSELQLIPILVISVIVMVIGIAFLIWGNFDKSNTP